MSWGFWSLRTTNIGVLGKNACLRFVCQELIEFKVLVVKNDTQVIHKLRSHISLFQQSSYGGELTSYPQPEKSQKFSVKM